jgi:hypothetical protein
MTGGTVAVWERRAQLCCRNVRAPSWTSTSQVRKRCNTAHGRVAAGLHAESGAGSKLGRELWHLGESDEVNLRVLIERHAQYTGSRRARQILDEWANYRPKFVKVFPNEYKRALGELAAKSRKLAA